jgi:voltage-gated potassium channel
MLKILLEVTRHTLFRVILGILVFSFIGAVLVSIFEGKINEEFSTLGDAIWWALVTMTTVGYGDRVPISSGGRIIAIFIMFFGVALISIFTATISSIFVARKIKEGRGLEEIKFKNHIIICGWNFSGEQILSILQQRPKETGPIVLINQLNEEAIADIIERFTTLNIKYVRGDYSQENVLNRANVSVAQTVLILPDTSAALGTKSDEKTILATLSIKSINPKTKVFAHILDRENLSHIRKAKADDVLISDAYSGYLLAAHIRSPGIPQVVDRLFSDEEAHKLDRIDIPYQYHGKSYGELRSTIERENNTICIGLGREQVGMDMSGLLSDDYSFIDQFIKRKFEEAGRGFKDEKKINIQINPAADTEIDNKDFLIVITTGDKLQS